MKNTVKSQNKKIWSMKLTQETIKELQDTKLQLSLLETRVTEENKICQREKVWINK